ncbi:MAG: hypothetical protein ACD_54C01300G0002 [uncultured bacterium]|nr:MAG: hypothetical protein ACD_54C01300G0002 [uncultured bacterium]
MQQVGIDRERRFAALVFRNRNLVRFGKLDQLGAAGQIPFAPRRDHLDGRVQGVGAKFKPHLIVALAGCTMRHGISAGFFRDPHQMFGDQRARNRGAQQIQAFIQRIGTEHREDEILHEFFAHIDDVDILFLDAQQFGLGAGRLQFFALPQIGGEGDNLAAIFGLQPFQDDRGIKPAGIGEDDFLRCGHVQLHHGFRPRLSGNWR